MNSIRFLFDECLPMSILEALADLEPSIDFRKVGKDHDAPPKGTKDPELLRFAEIENYVVVTFDKSTMKDHAVNHMKIGNLLRGVFIVRKGNYLSAGRIAEELLLIWSASQADEWIGRIEYIPYGK